MEGGLIFGRSPNLILALLAGAFNVVVLFHVGGFMPSGEQIAGVNTFFAAVVAVIANTSGIQIAAGKAAQARKDE